MDLNDEITIVNENRDCQLEIKAESTISISFWKNLYKWRMRHYFYIHVLFFIFIGLLGGLALFIIENYIKPNRFMSITYIDAWFVAASCVYSCGLTTFDFARLSTHSQMLLMILTILGGITVSTLPALVIKAQTHKHESGPKVDDDHSAFLLRRESERSIECSIEAKIKISRLPTAEQLCYRAYVYCLILIPLTCLTIYLGAFIAIGCWLQMKYQPSQLRQDGQPINSWYATLIITISGFNQNGLAPWSDSLSRFINDGLLNILIMMVSDVLLK
jgi:Trk-type K+ transport system membrane component